MWVQSPVEKSIISVRCVKGIDNPADIGTEILDGKRISVLKPLLGIYTWSEVKAGVAAYGYVAPLRVDTRSFPFMETIVASVLASLPVQVQTFASGLETYDYDDDVYATADAIGMYGMLAFIGLLSLIIGICGERFLSARARAEAIDVASQSPVTYKRKQSRFQPLLEYCWG